MLERFTLAGDVQVAENVTALSDGYTSLSLINRRMAMEVKDLFSFVSGRSLETPTLIGNFDKKDSDEIFM
ncbi:MAG: hypothetical protein IPG02_17615 [Ignavibacteria bacterium]|nr:hypothetical protein [Ignavibacteria bacterium]